MPLENIIEQLRYCNIGGKTSADCLGDCADVQPFARCQPGDDSNSLQCGASFTPAKRFNPLRSQKRNLHQVTHCWILDKALPLQVAKKHIVISRDLACDRRCIHRRIALGHTSKLTKESLNHSATGQFLENPFGSW